MEGHIHVSVVSVTVIVAVVVLTTMALHLAALRLSASDDPGTQEWGKAFAAAFG